MIMKRTIVFCMLCILMVQPVSAQKRNPEKILKGIKWNSPKRTNIREIDAIYNRGDSIYKHILDMSCNLVFYDVKQIVNVETGDTIIRVVDDRGTIRGKKMAAMQYITATAYGLGLLNDTKGLVDDAKELTKKPGPAWDFLKKDPLGTGLTFGTAISQIGKMSKAVKGVTDAFKLQKRKIRFYIKEGENIGKGVVNGSESNVSLDFGESLSKTSQQILEEDALADLEDEKAISDGFDISGDDNDEN